MSIQIFKCKEQIYVETRQGNRFKPLQGRLPTSNACAKFLVRVNFESEVDCWRRRLRRNAMDQLKYADQKCDGCRCAAHGAVDIYFFAAFNIFSISLSSRAGAGNSSRGMKMNFSQITFRVSLSFVTR